jgi:hypothetical protein
MLHSSDMLLSKSAWDQEVTHNFPILRAHFPKRKEYLDGLMGQLGLPLFSTNRLVHERVDSIMLHLNAKVKGGSRGNVGDLGFDLEGQIVFVLAALEDVSAKTDPFVPCGKTAYRYFATDPEIVLTGELRVWGLSCNCATHKKKVWIPLN